MSLLCLKMESLFLEKLNILKKSTDLKEEVSQISYHYTLYTNQYLKASKEQKKWMDKNCDYILNKIKTLEKKHIY